jgi:hypothetical protein
LTWVASAAFLIVFAEVSFRVVLLCISAPNQLRLIDSVNR